MSIPQIRTEAIEAVGRKILMEYDPSLLSGQPCPVPIETIIETKFDLILEFHTLRKKPKILGETIFDDGAVVLYDQIQRQYRMIAVRAGTILIDERLCDPSKLGRLRFTCAHELAHWVLHKKLYSGTGDVAAYNGKVSSDESHGIIERQADTLASALLMPLPQIKKCFYRLKIGRTDEQLIAEMANIFEVSKQAVAYMLVERKKEIDELMDLFGDEYIDNNLVFCSSNGRPMESQVINRAFNKLIKENGLPHVVFHSLRHSSITYKLKLNGGDMKSVQGDSGHAQVKMVADVYSHIIDEDRCINAQRLEEAFYSSKTPDPVEDTEPKTADTAVTESDESDAAKILELLKNPETAALLKQLAKAL